ncbi:MAG TPA: YdaU family protein [Acidobacteriaceae bacterium]|jgi:uncharacterized protein YdaU (DUF1376 family)
MNYYERHLGDYLKDTISLTMLEEGAYTRLLDYYYSKEHGIPADKAHKIARATSKEERAAVDSVLAEFFKLNGGVWIKGRCQEEIERAHVKITTAQENGRKGGRPPKKPTGLLDETQQKPTGLFLGSENETQHITQTKALQSPVSSLHPDEDSRRGEDPPPVGSLKTQIYRLAGQLEIHAGVITPAIQAHSEHEVWQALGKTLAAKPAEALPYFRGCLKTKTVEGRFKSA